MKKFIAFLLPLALVACSPSKDQLKKVLEENPEILTNAFEKNPVEILDALNNAAREAQKKQAERQEEDSKKAAEEEFNNPKQPALEGRAAWGPADAPITIVEYSDFQCPFCSRGYATINELKEKYKGKVRFIYKHLPLPNHPLAQPAAEYFEAIALQSVEKAYKFHDLLFENQSKLSKSYMEETAKKVGADLAKLKKDLKADSVKKNIEADMAEANKFEIFGTPGFLVNGVSVKGAYPTSHFVTIIDRHLEKK
ncbi:MAG: thiol:disulfide interchange protein [Bdellovibrionales bacterium CG10_big_fil_rev_8_21_14_0_10_45_34]|nr:MAG: thiol:disulfide interchange protein [Bdellovibrionales bacterium CG10_big_fil_rev_8_21_14_0_10_45_34]